MDIRLIGTQGINVDGLKLWLYINCDCGYKTETVVRVKECTNVVAVCTHCNLSSSPHKILNLLHEYLRKFIRTNMIIMMENIYYNSIEGYEKLHG